MLIFANYQPTHSTFEYNVIAISSAGRKHSYLSHDGTHLKVNRLTKYSGNQGVFTTLHQIVVEIMYVDQSYGPSTQPTNRTHLLKITFLTCANPMKIYVLGLC